MCSDGTHRLLVSTLLSSCSHGIPTEPTCVNGTSQCCDDIMKNTDNILKIMLLYCLKSLMLAIFSLTTIVILLKHAENVNCHNYMGNIHHISIDVCVLSLFLVLVSEIKGILMSLSPSILLECLVQYFFLKQIMV